MTQVGKLLVSWEGLLGAMAKLVRTWEPVPAKNEIAYRDQLLAFIRRAVPADTRIEREYRHRGTTVDLWIEWKGLFVGDELAAELKVNLKKKSELDRLVGQIESMNPSKHKVLVVLIGETDEALLGRLRARYADFIAPPLASGARLAIVEVPVATTISDKPRVD